MPFQLAMCYHFVNSYLSQTYQVSQVLLACYKLCIIFLVLY